MRRSQDVTYYAASLMNLRTRPTRLLRLGVETSSVTIQYCTSLKRRRKTSKLAVICAGRRVRGGNHIRRKVRQHILASFNCLRESLRQTGMEGGEVRGVDRAERRDPLGKTQFAAAWQMPDLWTVPEQTWLRIVKLLEPKKLWVGQGQGEYQPKGWGLPAVSA